MAKGPYLVARPPVLRMAWLPSANRDSVPAASNDVQISRAGRDGHSRVCMFRIDLHSKAFERRRWQCHCDEHSSLKDTVRSGHTERTLLQ
eukprot:SAG11_NODE_23254_length_392_cov_0.703072_1_plen_89_part_01